MKTLINYKDEDYLIELKSLLDNIEKDSLANAIQEIKQTFEKGSIIFTCGNGGSAMIASHYINDWVKSVNVYGGKKFEGFCLSDNTGLLTSYANDCSYEKIFSEVCKSYLSKEDLLIVVSGSGNSPNVINAINEAKKIGAKTLAILGYDGGHAIKIVDKSLHVPSFDMQICEDFFMIFGHMVMKSLTNCKIVKS